RRLVETMDLIEIDRLDPESFEARLASLDDVFPRESAHVRAIGHRPEDFRRDDDLIELRHRAQRTSDHLFAPSERVHGGWVEEVDAVVERSLEERLCGGFVQDPRSPLRTAVAHAAEADA